MAHTHRRVSLSKQCLAIGLATFALIGQLASLSHLVLVRHTVCLEHGELIHPDEASARGVATTHLSESLASALRPAPEATGSHGHEHCAIAAHRRERVVVLAASALALELPAEGPRLSPGTTDAQLTPRAVYRFAPKSSPPDLTPAA